MNKSTYKYIAKRLIMSVVTLFIILLILFLMLKLMPGTPFNDEKLSETQKILVEQKYGLDQPFLVQFWNYLKNMLQGDFGISFGISTNLAVSTLVGPRILVSFVIGVGAVVVGSTIGICLGIFAALHKNTIWDSLATGISVLGVSIPSFVFALVLLIVFGVNLKWFPIVFNSNKFISSSIIPIVALSVGVIANIARFTRSEMIEVMSSEYILLAEAKGLSKRAIVMKHGIRNTLISVITVLAPIVVSLMTGSMVIEKICGVPGLGQLLVKAIEVNDYNVVLAIAFLYSVMYVLIMLVVDISYGLIDPRIRLSKEGGA